MCITNRLSNSVGQSWGIKPKMGARIDIFKDPHYRLAVPDLEWNTPDLGLSFITYTGADAELTAAPRRTSESPVDYILREWRRHQKEAPIYKYPWNLPGMTFLKPKAPPLTLLQNQSLGSLIFAYPQVPNTPFGSSAWKFPTKWLRAIVEQKTNTPWGEPRMVPARILTSLQGYKQEIPLFQWTRWNPVDSKIVIDFALGKGPFYKNELREAEKKVWAVQGLRKKKVDELRSTFDRKLFRLSLALEAVTLVDPQANPAQRANYEAAQRALYETILKQVKIAVSDAVQALKEDAFLSAEEELYLANQGDRGIYDVPTIGTRGVPPTWLVSYKKAKDVQNKLLELMRDPHTFAEYGKIKEQVENAISQGRFEEALKLVQTVETGQKSPIVRKIRADTEEVREEAYRGPQGAYAIVREEGRKELQKYYRSWQGKLAAFDTSIRRFAGSGELEKWLPYAGGAIGAGLGMGVMRIPGSLLGMLPGGGAFSGILTIGGLVGGGLAGYYFTKNLVGSFGPMATSMLGLLGLTGGHSTDHPRFVVNGKEFHVPTVKNTLAIRGR